MKVQGVNSTKLQTFTANDTPITTPQTKEENKINKKEIVKISAAVLATALAAVTITNIVKGKSCDKTIRNLEEQFRRHAQDMEEPFRRQIQGLQDALDESNKQIKRVNQELSELNNKNGKLDELNKKLKQEAEAAKNKLNDIFDGDTTPQDVRTKLYTDLKSKVEAKDLGYDIMEPPVTGLKKEGETFQDAIPFPQRMKSGKRADMQELNIPEIKEDGSFNYTLPKSDEIKISTAETIDFKPRKDMVTNISEGYSESVVWNNDKIARDIIQNFYDGHGQTLNGVRFKFEPTANGKYKVRIEGDSSYTADKAIFIGESTKREDMAAAGNYGEGLKMASLKLLKDKGAKNVRIGSDNWDLTFRLGDIDLLKDKKIMYWDLDKSAKKAGNYIEFETDDKELLETMRKTINRFYHSGNVHFKNPDFENDMIAITVLRQPTKSFFSKTPGEKGAMYICGQRFEFENAYDGLEGAIINLKQKPPKEVLDTSRDRVSLNSSDLDKLALWLCDKSSMTKQERIDLIMALEPVWNRIDYLKATPLSEFCRKFVLWQGAYVNKNFPNRTVHINFPKDKYVAYSNATSEVVSSLERKGYKVCMPEFADLGMQTIRDLLGDARKHDPIAPTAQQLIKIKVLKEALKKLAPSLEKENFSPAEIDTKIFLFNNTANKEARLYSSTLAEAITDNGVSKGFWIDKNYLNNGDFSEVLETALHELCHKVGGDESMEFSYKLTDVNKKAIKQILNNAETRAQLQALNRIWNECTDLVAA